MSRDEGQRARRPDRGDGDRQDEAQGALRPGRGDGDRQDEAQGALRPGRGDDDRQDEAQGAQRPDRGDGEGRKERPVTPFFWLRLLRRMVTFVVLLAVGIYAATYIAVWKTARQDSRPRSDAIVVLGTAQYNGRPSAIFTARLEHAKRLYNDGIAPRVVTVGGKQPGDRFTEADAGRRWLLSHGVPSGAAVAVPEGTDTLQSVLAVDRLFAKRAWHSAVLVSDPWHMLRAHRMASDSGIEAANSPARTGPAVYTRAVQVRYIAREAAAYLSYRSLHLR